jgi:transmembrane sensor
MNDLRSRKLNTQISEEAAEWFIEFRTGELDAAARRSFDAWVRSSPEHLRAYLEIAAIWNEGHALDGAHKHDPQVLVERARAQDALIPLAEWRESKDPVRRASFFSRPRQRAIALMAMCLMLAAALFVWLAIERAPTFVTDVGEQRSVRLPDGSTVELNSRSRVRVRFSDEARLVELLEGQALFRVAKNTARPFIVRSHDTQVRAVGTQFDVYRKPSGTVVTVVEGKVAVFNPGSNQVAETRAHSGVLLSAGDQLILAPKSHPQPARVNTAAAIAWTQRRLVFESTPLTDVAEEFNRYSTRKLIVEDSASSPLRLSGVFETDPDFLIRYVRERPDITVSETHSYIRIVRHD